MGALLLVALPASFYTAVHWVALASWTHLWSLLILGAAPWCFLLALEGVVQPAPLPEPKHIFCTQLLRVHLILRPFVSERPHFCTWITA